ncbi:MAG: hypothetical protein ACYT04_40530 [Nostoc sp.]
MDTDKSLVFICIHLCFHFQKINFCKSMLSSVNPIDKISDRTPLVRLRTDIFSVAMESTK